VKFKNDLERKCFETAERALGGGVTLKHNMTIQIETALFPEIASFKGPPSKEIDILVAELLDQPKVVLLVSCKLLSRRAEPAHVQEWAAVVQTMNRYSAGTQYFGLLVSPSGFTGGCEAWATSHNLGIVPPLKGRSVTFSEETVYRMFERSLVALRARLRLRNDDLGVAPAFFDFIYRIVADFEGHQEAETDGRYRMLPHGWASSFGEMYHAIAGLTIQDLLVSEHSTTVVFAEGAVLQFGAGQVAFGPGTQSPRQAPGSTTQCFKNIEMEPCTVDFIRSIAVGKQITSAGDFGAYLEVGLDQRYNLGLHETGFHLFSTENPVEEHRL